MFSVFFSCLLHCNGSFSSMPVAAKHSSSWWKTTLWQVSRKNKMLAFFTTLRSAHGQDTHIQTHKYIHTYILIFAWTQTPCHTKGVNIFQATWAKRKNLYTPFLKFTHVHVHVCMYVAAGKRAFIFNICKKYVCQHSTTVRPLNLVSVVRLMKTI